MEKYTAPELEIIAFEAEDVITTSNFTTDKKEGDLPIL